MNFLKTLMTYMALTFAVSVQTTCTPFITPEPTPAPAPTAVVSTELPAAETEVPDQIPAGPVSATPSPVVTAVPTPALTPNKAYKTLNNKSRGEDVKRLQEKLIELGYLNDKADGAYGNKTKKAVQKFQASNGLDQDGIAGRATQTVLFEDPNVVANPDKATATPVPTDTPNPEAAPEATAAAEESQEPVPEEPTLQPIEKASVILNDSGAALTCLRKEDGVYINSKPRVYREGEAIYVSLRDLCAAVSGWELTESENGLLFTTEDREILIQPGEEGAVAILDGNTLDIAPAFFRLSGTDKVVSAAFLDKALDATVLWDEEEATLMLRTIPDASAGAEG